MATSILSYCLQGLNVHPVRVEVELSRGMPYFGIIGMAGTSVKESADRVRSAIQASGLEFPMTRKIVNLAPADLHKHGTHFDLPMALGLLCESGQLSELPADTLILGELGLDGGVREVPGVLPLLQRAKADGVLRAVIPRGNLAEASWVEGLELYPVNSLREVLNHFMAKGRRPERHALEALHRPWPWDFGDISGHIFAKRALCVAAVGGHHVLMSGPPGSGKSLLARAFPSILPPLSQEEILEVLHIHSVAGETYSYHGERPLRTVHSSVTERGLIGGGLHLQPGEMSLAHRGVLHLDELPEFKRSVLELLRIPLEEGCISLRRGRLQSRFPAQFQMIAAMNPCPCGYFGDSQKRCKCISYEVEQYQKRLSGPLLDRIDIKLSIPRISFDELQGKTQENSAQLKEKVLAARMRNPGKLNRDLSPKEVLAEPLDAQSKLYLKSLTQSQALSGRAVHKIIKVARSVADLDGDSRIALSHLMEAAQYGWV